jgi:small subunit ribosomal protein S20
MPYHLSPEKRLRRDERVRLRNKSRMSRVRNFIKKARLSLAGDLSVQDNIESVRLAQSELAKGASKGVMHKKTASRKIARLMKKLAQKATQGSGTSV